MPRRARLGNGAPGSKNVALIEDDFGVMVAQDRFFSSEFQGLQSVTMHELSYALGAGWADDDLIGVFGIGFPNGLEAYSGDSINPTIGLDETSEVVRIGGSPTRFWSITMRGPAADISLGRNSPPTFVFSLEEADTIDFEHIPSRGD